MVELQRQQRTSSEIRDFSGGSQHRPHVVRLAGFTPRVTPWLLADHLFPELIPGTVTNT